MLLIFGCIFYFTGFANQVAFGEQEDGNQNTVTPLTFTTNTTKPAKPTNLTALASEANLSVTLTWTKASNHSSIPVTGYKLLVRKDNGNLKTFTIPGSNADTTSYTVTNPFDNSNSYFELGYLYKFKIVAVNDNGDTESDEVEEVLNAVPTFGEGANRSRIDNFEFTKDVDIDYVDDEIELQDATTGRLIEASGGNLKNAAGNRNPDSANTRAYRIVCYNAQGQVDDDAKPAGVRFGGRTMIGKPTEVQAETNCALIVSDSHDLDHMGPDDEDKLEFTITVLGDRAPTFGTQTIDDQEYIKDVAIETLALPEASLGNGQLSYSLTDSTQLPAGLSWNSSSRQISGRPSAVFNKKEYTYTVSDQDSFTGPSDEASLKFHITVVDDFTPTFGNETIDNEIYQQTETIATKTLPEASSGNPPLAYSLGATPALPTGLEFNASTRQITGTITGDTQAEEVYTYTVTDKNGDTASINFKITVTEVNQVPSFGSQTVPEQSYIVNSAIETLVLPTATGGNGALTYSLSSTASTSQNVTGLPSGLRFIDGTTNAPKIIGTPSAALVKTEFTLTVTDNDLYTGSTDEDTLKFHITVAADAQPTFGSGSDRKTIDDEVYEQQQNISAKTLPEASSGNPPLTYSLGASPALPAGLTFNATTRQITGTITGDPHRVQSYTYQVTDKDGDTDSIQFNITVTEINTVPRFTETVPNQTYVKGQSIDKLVLPKATLGNLPLSYSISPNPPVTGLTFTVDPNEISITGRPTAEPGTTSVTYTVTDNAFAGNASDTAVLTFTITVVEDAAPEFSVTSFEVELPHSRNIRQQLPKATGGNGALEYSLGSALPAGLSLNPLTGLITGKMAATVPLGSTNYTYSVKDADKNEAVGDTDELVLTITVTEPPPVDEELIETSMQQTLSETAGIISGITMSSIRIRVQNYSASQVSSSTSLNARDDRRWLSHVGREPVRMDADEFMRSGEFLSLVNAYSGSGVGDRSYLFWSDAAHNRFKDDSSALKYDGEVSGISFGVDTPLGEGVVGGVSLSRFTGKTDYTQSDGNTGRQKIRATSVSPYFGLRTADSTMWTFVGVGSGNFRLEQDNLSETSDLSLNAVGVGGSTQVWSNAKTTVHLAGDFTLTELSVDASSGFIPEQDSSVNRTRLVLEASQRRQTSRGGVVEPSVEFGVANDSGDGSTGSRIEVGAGMNYRSASQRVTLSLSSYGLLKRNNSSEWGVQGGIHMQPGEGGNGMSFNLKPSYGAAVRGVDRIWEIGSTDDVAGEESYRPRLDAGLSYGFRIVGDRGLLTPYSEVSLEGDDRTYRVGTRFRIGSNFELNLVGESVELVNDEPESSIHFQGGIRF